MERSASYHREYKLQYEGTLSSIHEQLQQSTERRWYEGQRDSSLSFIQSIVNQNGVIDTIRIYSDWTTTFKLSSPNISEQSWEESIVKATLTLLEKLGAKEIQKNS